VGLTFKTKNRRKFKESGFTIVEVLIVLAIASIIMTIVLLTVPALERERRNYARKHYAQQVLSQLIQFQTENDGILPDCGSAATPAICAMAPSEASKFLTSYLPPSSIDDYSAATTASVDTSFCHGQANPSQSAVYCWDDQSAFYISHSLVPSQGQLIIVAQHFCGTHTGSPPYGDLNIKDTSAGATGGNPENEVSVLIGLEGGLGYYCVNN
jgi:prepilin-type N-terminal cleavage/methylation domain-containing protein